MYRCFTDTEEAELTDDCAQSYFDFFHGKSHADTVTRPHSKRKKSVRVTFSFVIGAPPVSEIVHMVTIMVKKKITRFFVDIVPIGIKCFGIRITVRIVMESKRRHSNHGSFLDFDTVVSDVFVTFPLHSVLLNWK